jgi:hypothetical protein
MRSAGETKPFGEFELRDKTEAEVAQDQEEHAQARGALAAKEAFAQSAIIDILCGLPDSDSRERVHHSLNYLLMADRCTPGVLNRFIAEDA